MLLPLATSAQTSALPVGWGSNNSGQLAAPTSITGIESIHAGSQHVLAQASGGSIVGWGDNTFGQLNFPLALTNVAGLAAGTRHSLGLSSNGNVFAWGDNTFGQSVVPASLSNAVLIAAGGFHSLAVGQDGAIVGWGANMFGQSTPPATPGNVVAVAAGGYFSVALLSDGGVLAWGFNGNGQTNVPATLTNAIAIAPGFNHCVALLSDGTVTAWGYNGQGQTSVPPGLSNVIAVAAGFDHSLALKSDGTVVGWGGNSSGQSVAPSNFTQCVAIAAGNSFSFAATAAPIIRTQPTNQLLVVNADAQFDIDVLSATPVSCQWLFEGAPVSGATNFSLVISNTQISHGGAYSAVVSNSHGALLSATAFLSPAPVILSGSTNRIGQFGGDMAFISTVDCIAPVAYQWQFKGVNIAGATSSVYIRSNTQPVHVGDYRLIVTSSVGSATSSPAWLSLVSSNQLAKPGFSITLSITSAVPQLLQWQLNGVDLAGQTNRNLLLMNLQASQSGGYRVRADDGNGPVFSPDIAVTVSLPPVITNPPMSQTVIQNSNATFTVGASATPPPAYQWLFNNAVIGGATNSVLAIVNAQAGNAGNYRVVVTNFGGASTSAPAALTVVFPPAISSQPASLVRPAGTNAAFTVAATGTGPLTFQWHFNGTALTGATNATLLVSNIQPANAGNYFAVVTNNYGSVTSALATLTVNPSSPFIASQPRDWVMIAGTNATFSVVARGLEPLAYEWRFNGGVISETGPAVTLTNVQSTNAGRFQVIVSNPEGSVTSSVATLTVYPAEVGTVVIWPPNSAMPTGLCEVVSVKVNLALKRDGKVVGWASGLGSQVPAGLPPLAAISGGSDSAIGLKNDSTVVAWGNDGFGGYIPPPGWLSNVVAIAKGNLALRSDGTVVGWGWGAFPPQGIVLHSNVVAIAVGNDFWLTLNQNGTVSAYGSNSHGTNMPAGLSNIKAIACGNQHALALRSDGTVVAWGLNASGQATVPTGLNDVKAIGCGQIHSLAVRSNGTVVAWGYNDSGQCNVPTGLSNVVQVIGGYSDSFALKAVNLGIYSQPASITNKAGSNVTFTVVAYSFLPATYQWFLNNQPIPGATNAALTLTNIQPVNAGLYKVHVTNPEAMCESDTARLVVVPAPFLPFPSGTSGRVTAWGRNIYGETSVPPGLSNVVGIASGAGSLDTFAFVDDGRIFRWGGGVGLHPAVTNLVNVVGAINYNLGLHNNGTVTYWSGGTVDTFVDLTGVRAIGACGPLFALQTNGTVVNLGGGTSLLAGVTNATALAVGQGHALALLSDGTLALGKYNYPYSGQTPLPPGINNVMSIAAGVDHCLALHSNGTITAWGANSSGQCSVPPGLSNVIAIAAAGNHSLALKSDRTVVAWGDSSSGLNEPPAGLTNVIAIACGWVHNVALRAGPVFTSVPTNVVAAFGTTVVFQGLAEANTPVAYQWFFNGAPLPDATNASLTLLNVQAQHAGDYTLRAEADGFRVEASARLSFGVPPVIVSGPANVWANPGETATFTVVATNEATLLYQWFFGSTLLPGETNSTLLVTNVQPNLAGIYRVRVSTAWAFETNRTATLSLLSTRPMGSVLAWESTTNVPTELSGVIQVSGGVYHSAALRADGTVVEWDNASLALLPVPTNLNQVVSIAAGGYHTLALRKDGTIAGWGNNYNGQASPPGLSDTAAIAAGNSFSVALRSNGTAVVWGNGYGGVLSIPADATNMVAIAAGADYVLGLRNDGSLVGWGSRVPPAGLSNIMAIAAGHQNSMALRNDGQVFAWGLNYFGENNVPSDLSNVVAIAAGYSRCLALQSNRIVRGWGSTVPPAYLTNIVAIAAGDYTSLAVRETGVFITRQPQSITNLAGTPASFSVEAAGSWPLTYQWKHNGTNIPGATNPVLLLGPVQDTNAGIYTVVVASPAGEAVSAPATLTVLSAPRFVVQPSSQTIPAGSNAIFSAQVAGTAPFNYQWRSNGINLPGQTGTNLTLTNVTWLATNVYQIRVSNAYGSVTSAPATLTVQVPPKIVTPPASQLAVLYSNVTFTVTAAGSGPLEYTWLFENTPLESSAGPALVLSNVQETSAGNYRVVVANAFGSVTSSPAALSILPLAPSIITQPASRIVPVGSNPSFQVTALGAAPLDYQWRFEGNPIPNGTSPTLALSQVQGSSAGTYDVIIANPFGSVTSTPAQLQVTPRANVVAWGLNDRGQTNVPASMTNIIAISADANHVLALRADGTVTGWGTNDSGQLNTPPGLSNVIAVSAGQFHSLALRADGTVAAWGTNTYGQASVPAGLTNVVAISAGTLHNLALKADGTVVGWGYNAYGQASPSPTLTNVAAIAAGYEHSMALRSNGTIVTWGSYYGDPFTITNVAAISGRSFTFLLLRKDGTVMRWGSQTLEGVTNAVAVSAGGHAISAQPHHLALLSNRTVAAWGANTYGQATPPAGLSNVVAVSAGYSFSVALLGAPEFITQPLSLTVVEGQTATFTAAVYSFLPATLQWRLNGTNIPGATNLSLFLPSTSLAQQGGYTVVASNHAGAVTSATATLTVIPFVPVITGGPTNLTIVAGANATFAVSAVGAGPLSYQWRFKGSNVPGATSSNFTILNCTTNHTGGYSVTVANAYGSVESAPAALTVLASQWIIDNPQASFAGAWTLTGSGPGRFGINYRVKSQGTGTGTARYIPSMPAAGVYEVYEWHPAGTNRSAAAPHFIDHAGGTELVLVNQQVDGGQWNLLGTFLFAAGTNGGVRISDAFPDAGQVAVADAIRFAYVPPPTIVRQPLNQSVMTGDSALFNVAAVSASPIYYQWHKEEAAISGATTDQLFLATVQPSQSGSYRVALTNAGGATVSDFAALSVGVPLHISVDNGFSTLTWEGPFVLQTATNLPGPYVDIPTETNSWTLPMSDDPQRFFRLRPDF